MIISVFPSGERASYCLPLPNIIHYIKSGTYKEAVAKAREFYRQIEGKRYREALETIPCFSPAGHFKRSLRRESLVSYSGCVLLETVSIPDDLMLEVRQIIERNPMTLACFQNVSGDQLVIIVRTNDNIENYRIQFHELLDYFEKLLPVSLNTEPDYPYRLCSLSHDPFAYFNPGASSSPATIPVPLPKPPARNECVAIPIPKVARTPVLNTRFPVLPPAQIPISAHN